MGIEPGDGDWVVYDEEDLGDVGPSSWQIGASQLDGDAMTQNSNIWGDASDAVAIGSFVVYDKAEWSDFALEVAFWPTTTTEWGLSGDGRTC